MAKKNTKPETPDLSNVEPVSDFEKRTAMRRLSNAGVKWQADAYFDEVRRRMMREAGLTQRHPSTEREPVRHAAWRIMYETFLPSVERYEKKMESHQQQLKKATSQQLKKASSQQQQNDTTAQLEGMPPRTTDDMLDPEYVETDLGKQLRDGLLWAALEFDRVIEDTDDGPVAHLEDASSPPPNAFAVGVMRTYALSPLEKRRDLIGRALAFAHKSHEDSPPNEDEEGAFLHELD